ncbi:hypothetical protein [Massilia sp. S19_KUP03_FR1]|uniref:hypothetical protein n=1 Tax=Massilia sp. S19_KUP03_FR1 TaxID=3025503 RepID=UPI002FCD43B1
MREHLWRAHITRAVHSNDPAQINALASRLAADERLAIALQAHGYQLNGQPIDVVVCRALNVKACDE